MKIPGTLYLLSGKMAAGKSTLAKQLSQNHDAILISEDKFLASLYPGEISDVPTYVQQSARLKSAIESLVVELLTVGTSVVLDFPANTLNQRSWMKGVLSQTDAPHELHYINLSDSQCMAQLLQRAADNPERAATDTREMFDAICNYFEPPSQEEDFNVILHLKD